MNPRYPGADYRYQVETATRTNANGFLERTDFNVGRPVRDQVIMPEEIHELTMALEHGDYIYLEQVGLL